MQNDKISDLLSEDFLRIMGRDLEATLMSMDAGDPLAVWKLHYDVARRLVKELKANAGR